MSCELDLGIQDVVERCWQELQLMRIYTKRCGALLLKEIIQLTNLQERGRARLQRGLDRKKQIFDRRSLRSGSSDA